MKGIVDTYGPVITEVSSRPIRSSKIPIINITPDKSGKSPLLTSTGTITIYIAKKGSGELEKVKMAASQGGERIEELHKHINSQIKKTESSSIPDFVKIMIKEPVLAEIRYGGTTLSNGFFLPKKVDLFPIPYAYIGGAVAEEGLTLTEYFKEGSEVAFEALAVRVEPNLTDAEKEAIRLLPSNELSRNVAALADWCDTTWWAVAAAVVAAAHVTVEVTCKCALMAEVHLSDEAIRKLGPTLSARQLMNLRRQVFQKHFST